MVVAAKQNVHELAYDLGLKVSVGPLRARTAGGYLSWDQDLLRMTVWRERGETRQRICHTHRPPDELLDMLGDLVELYARERAWPQPVHVPMRPARPAADIRASGKEGFQRGAKPESYIARGGSPPAGGWLALGS